MHPQEYEQKKCPYIALEAWNYQCQQTLLSSLLHKYYLPSSHPSDSERYEKRYCYFIIFKIGLVDNIKKEFSTVTLVLALKDIKMQSDAWVQLFWA